MSNHTCSLHTCVCAGSRRERVRLSGLINGRNQFNSWGSPQVPHSGPGLCRTVETIGFECGLQLLGASNIGSNSKSCSHSTQKQQGLFNRTSVGTATAVHRTEITAWAVHKVRENSGSCSSVEWQRKLFISTSGSESCSSERVTAKAVHQNEWQRKLFIRMSGSKSCSSERVAA